MAAEPRTPDSPLWVDPSAVAGETLRLDSDETHHLLHVFRAEPGSPFEAVDGRGRAYRCVLLSADREGAVGRVLDCREGTGELPAPIWVLAGMPTPSAAEELVARAVPLGASHVIFYAAARAERWRSTPSRVARFDRLARAALKQSRRSRLPSIQLAGSLEGALTAAPAAGRYLADPEGPAWSESASTGVLGGIALAVGPPGGLTGQELALLRDSGFHAISLGPSRLTTQDAALALLALARERVLAAARH